MDAGADDHGVDAGVDGGAEPGADAGPREVGTELLVELREAAGWHLFPGGYDPDGSPLADVPLAVRIDGEDLVVRRSTDAAGTVLIETVGLASDDTVTIVAASPFGDIFNYHGLWSVPIGEVGTIEDDRWTVVLDALPGYTDVTLDVGVSGLTLGSEAQVMAGQFLLDDQSANVDREGRFEPSARVAVPDRFWVYVVSKRRRVSGDSLLEYAYAGREVDRAGRTEISVTLDAVDDAIELTETPVDLGPLAAGAQPEHDFCTPFAIGGLQASLGAAFEQGCDQYPSIWWPIEVDGAMASYATMANTGAYVQLFRPEPPVPGLTERIDRLPVDVAGPALAADYPEYDTLNDLLTDAGPVPAGAYRQLLWTQAPGRLTLRTGESPVGPLVLPGDADLATLSTLPGSREVTVCHAVDVGPTLGAPDERVRRCVITLATGDLIELR